MPFQATVAGAPYATIRRLPVTVLLASVRSLYNVGAFFRTGEAAGIEKLWLCGITGRPPKNAIRKTALGAEERVPWEHSWDPVAVAQQLRASGHEIAAVETSLHSVDLFEWAPAFPLCVVFGHEVEGIRPELVAFYERTLHQPDAFLDENRMSRAELAHKLEQWKHPG